jgi:uncharacterized protein
MNTVRPAPDAAPAPLPWWRVRLMWFVVGGPLAVVVASFTTLALAILHPDPVLVAAPGSTPSQRPAVEMRNHAATTAPPAPGR